jgi:hypothetical protein
MSGLLIHVPNLATLTFRDAIREISPRWLKHGLAEKILYSFGIHMDLLGDAAADGIKKSFPTLLDAVDAFGMIGRSRKIARGPNEPDVTYAARLLPWLDFHRTRGGPYAMLRQLQLFWSAAPFAIDLVYESGKRFHSSVFGAITESTGSPWDGNTARWARWWAVFDWPGAVTTDGIWSDPGVWDDLGTWDTSLTVAEVAEIRLIPNEWNAAHTLGYITLRISGAETWDVPADTWADGGVWAGGGSDFLLTLAVQ